MAVTTRLPFDSIRSLRAEASCRSCTASIATRSTRSWDIKSSSVRDTFNQRVKVAGKAGGVASLPFRGPLSEYEKIASVTQ
jgi:hypothetical protein